MGFDISGGSAGFGDAVLIVLGISVCIPVAIWFFVLVTRARKDVIEDTDTDLEA